MRIMWLIVVAVLIVGGFLVYMSSFTVRFTEAAVVTTFGQAGERARRRRDGNAFVHVGADHACTTRFECGNQHAAPTGRGDEADRLPGQFRQSGQRQQSFAVHATGRFHIGDTRAA